MKAASLFGRQCFCLVLLQMMGPSGTFLVASRKHRPNPCDRVPRNNGVEADRGFSCMPRGDDNRHLVL